ncbi:hypothetical protein, partial [Tychonema sp. LEGE 06208]|uniref:hypothetical protein n=1 Tax=Tychonema sp. LEGE 06208 TaxID=1828663 RepID=UPI001D14F262
PLDPPQPPLTRGELEQAKSSNGKGGTPLEVPLVKGDLGRSNNQVTLASIVEEMLDRLDVGLAMLTLHLLLLTLIQ